MLETNFCTIVFGDYSIKFSSVQRYSLDFHIYCGQFPHSLRKSTLEKVDVVWILEVISLTN